MDLINMAEKEEAISSPNLFKMRSVAGCPPDIKGVIMLVNWVTITVLKHCPKLNFLYFPVDIMNAKDSINHLEV